MQIVLARTTFQQQAKDIPNQNKMGMQHHTWAVENWKKSCSTQWGFFCQIWKMYPTGKQLSQVKQFPTIRIEFSAEKSNEVNL